MNRDDVKKHFGTFSRACEAIGLSKYAHTQWKLNVPLKRQLQFQALTNGKLSVDPHLAVSTLQDQILKKREKGKG